jgi:hypothetical protein
VELRPKMMMLIIIIMGHECVWEMVWGESEGEERQKGETEG